MAETWLVTGANRGMGLELARQALAAGNKVIATARNRAGATALDALCDLHPDRLQIETLDASDLKDVADFGVRLAGTSVDVFINNAGISRASWPGGAKQPEPADLDPSAWDEVLRVNLVAPFMLTMAMRRNLADSARKLVIMMSSDLGSIANNTMGGSYAYRASKAGLNMVMKGLAIDLAGDGIAVISMAPGWVRTELGGPSAHWSIEESVAHQLQVIAGLTSADSGKFINLLGEPVAW